jgi:hypothetical protein
MQESLQLSPPNQNYFDLAVVLDEAVNLLGPDDRNAVLLRSFQNQDLKTVGVALGVSEDAARMRVNRALDKLHRILVTRGVTLSATALGALLTTEAVSAVPPTLVVSISSAALAGTAINEKGLRVGALGWARGRPARNEVLDFQARHEGLLHEAMGRRQCWVWSTLRD